MRASNATAIPVPSGNRRSSMALSATAANDETGTTGRFNPQARPWITPVAIRNPVNEPGPRAKARPSRSEGTRSCSASSARTIGINRRVWPLGASSNCSVIWPSSHNAAEQPSEDVSSAKSFTERGLRGYSGVRLLELRQDLVADIVQTANAFNTHVFRCISRSLDRPVLIEADQWCGLIVVNSQTLAYGIFFVVFALNQRLAGFIVFTFNLWRIVLHVVNTATAFVNTAT